MASVKRSVWIFTISGSVLGALLLVSFLYPHFTKPGDDLCLLTAEDCQWQGGEWQLSLVNPDVNPLFPTRFELIAPEQQTRDIQIQLLGQEMYMGEVEFLMHKVADGRYQGEVMIPFCSTDEMYWFGRISSTDNDVLNIDFRLRSQ